MTFPLLYTLKQNFDAKCKVLSDGKLLVSFVSVWNTFEVEIHAREAFAKQILAFKSCPTAQKLDEWKLFEAICI